MIRHLSAFLLLLFISASASWAISPEEQLADPILEERARDLSAQLRCLVCQNQSIEDSDADLAKDLRREVRVQLQSGLADDEILKNLQATYGDYILLRPPVSQSTWILWSAPVIFIILAILLFVQSRRRQVQPSSISDEAPPPRELEPAEGAQSPALSRQSVILIMVVILLASASLYLLLGRPDLDARPLADRQTEITEARAAAAQQETELRAAFIEAQNRAARNPDSVEAQMAFALAAAELGDFPSEIEALRRSLALTDEAPEIKSMLAEAMSRQADGQIILPARQLIDEVLRIMPDEPRALFMKGLAAYQDEAFADAIEIWGRLRDTVTPESPWRALARRNIAAAAEAGGIALPDDNPLNQETAEDIASASAEDQAEMIAMMVASLEERLAEEPQDPEGWARLVRARRVLNDEDGLMRALIGAARSQPQTRNAQLELLEELLSRGLNKDYGDGADVALANLKALDPQALEYLFFAGHIARLKGELEAAIAFWQALRYKLPDEGEFTTQLSLQIEQLQNELAK